GLMRRIQLHLHSLKRRAPTTPEVYELLHKICNFLSLLKAKQFLASLKRPKRNLWDRSRPDVQQWIQQFMYMGFDEARLETDLAYWMDHYQSSDSPMGPRSAASYRHGANVIYDYY
uniref:ECRG4 augurin n=1 Tax=Sinocyclocheilus grahami TaxID=75366 RepID=A0A672K2P6_SINGR